MTMSEMFCLQFMEIPTPDDASPPHLQYDPEWLAVTRAFHPFLSLERRQVLPSHEEAEKCLDEARTWVEKNIVNAPSLQVPADEDGTRAVIESAAAVAGDGEAETAAPVIAQADDEGETETDVKKQEQEQEASDEQAPAAPANRPLTLLDVEATQYFYRTAPTQEEGGGGPGEWDPWPANSPQPELTSLALQAHGIPTPRPRPFVPSYKSPT